MTDRDASLDNWLEGIDLSTAPDDAEVLSEPLDTRALLLRRFAWDTMVCGQVEALLPKLGLTVGTPEGSDHEHRESHERMAPVMPFEQMLQQYAFIISTVLSTAVTEAHGLTEKMSPEDHAEFVGQNADLILSGGRAMIAQLFFTGLIGYGPMIDIKYGHLDEDGNVVIDEPAADDGQLPGQLTFDDVERGSEW